MLATTSGAQITRELDEAEEARRQISRQHYEDDADLSTLDDAELDAFILSEEEVRIKERVWIEINRDYLEAIAGAFCVRSVLVPFS